MKIIVALDGSAHSVKACKWVIGLTKNLVRRPSIRLVAADEPLSRSVSVQMGPTELARYHKDNGEYALKKARALLSRANLRWDEEFRVGHPPAVIVDAAKRARADIIVMGSHGRTAFRSLVLGSVTSKVIAGTSIPVVVIR